MKTILVCTLIMASSAVLAVNKCVIDGKTVYQQSPCVGESKAIEGNVSSVGSQYLRDKIVEKKIADELAQQAAIAQQRQDEAERKEKLKAAQESSDAARLNILWMHRPR